MKLSAKIKFILFVSSFMLYFLLNFFFFTPERSSLEYSSLPFNKNTLAPSSSFDGLVKRLALAKTLAGKELILRNFMNDLLINEGVHEGERVRQNIQKIVTYYTEVLKDQEESERLIQILQSYTSEEIVDKAPPYTLLVNLNHGQSANIKPIGLARVSANLKANNIPTSFIDGHQRELSPYELAEQIKATVKEQRNGVVLGISALPNDFDYLSEFLRYFPKEYKEKHKVFICVGGYLPSILVTDFFERVINSQNVDFIIRTEGDKAMVQAVKALKSGNVADLKGIRNVIYQYKREIRANPHRLLLPEELEELPMIDWSIFTDGSKKALLETARGCPNYCKFCGIHDVFFREKEAENRLLKEASLRKLFWREYSAKKVVDEMEFLHDEFGITGFDFVDDEFIGNNPKRAIEIADEIIRRGLNEKIRFWILTRARAIAKNEFVDVSQSNTPGVTVSVNLLEKLKEAGLVQIYLGIESFTKKQLLRYRKGTTAEQNRKAIQIIQNLDIDFKMGLINFDREVTLEEIENNIDTVRELGLEDAIASPAIKLMVYEGSPLYKEFSSKGIPLKNIITADESYSTVYDYDFIHEEIEYLYQTIKKMSALIWGFSRHFRFLKEMQHYEERKDIIDESKKVYASLKKLEFDCFQELLSFFISNNIRGRKLTKDEDIIAKEIVSYYYQERILPLVRGFNQKAAKSDLTKQWQYRLSKEEQSAFLPRTSHGIFSIYPHIIRLHFEHAA